MDAVLRALAIYLVMMVLFRIMGKRSLAQVTAFDFVVLLIVAEATQDALLGTGSITTTALVVTTLVGLDRLGDFVSYRWRRVEKLTESLPLVLVADGQPLRDRMAKEQVSDDDVLYSARRSGLERMDQVGYAVLEKSGGISVVPRSALEAAPSEQG